MHLRHLTLENFRCYERAEFDFPPGLTVALGPNASGKTTLLEALYLLATTTSPRTGNWRQMMRRGQSWARVTGLFERDGTELSLRVLLGDLAEGGSGKTLEVDGRRVTSAREVVGRVQVVLFWVGELEVVKGAPAERRRFLNQALGQLSARHLDDLARYRRALRQRNEVLRSLADGRQASGLNGRQLAPWTHALVEAGSAITLDRAGYVAALAAEAAPLHRRLGAGVEELSVAYRPSVPLAGDAPTEEDVAAAFYEALEARQSDELARGVTLVGPHRDDVALKVGGIDLRRYGSQGQQRTAALALTLAQARVARVRAQTEPILLLDDCLSELDASRAGAMLDLSADHDQMIVTSACCPEPLAGRLADAHVIQTGECACP